jgi:Domain of unknown function (DUF4440)
MIAFAFLGSAMTLATSVPQTRLGCPRHPMTSAGVLATEHEWVRALEARDSRALSCILANDFADTNWRGELVPRSAVLGRLSSRSPSRLKLTDLTVSQNGPLAIVRGINTQVAPDGRNAGSVRFTDVFVYLGGAWRAISAQESLIAKE